MHAAGISFSESEIAVMNLVASRHGMNVFSFDTLSVPKGSIENGSVAAPEHLRKVLGDFQKKKRISFARVAIPEESSYLVRLSVPAGSDAAIRRYLLEHLEEHVPLKPDNAIFDYVILAALEDTADILLSAAPRQVIDSFLEVFSDTGITLLSIEVDIQAVARAVVPAYETDAVGLINIGKNRTTIAIVVDGLVRFATTTDFGSGGLPKANGEKKKTSKERRDAIEAFGRELGTAVGEHLQYWETHRSSEEERNLERLIVCGEDVSEPDLFNYLAPFLPLHPALGNPWQNVLFLEKAIPPMTRRESFKYTTAIGLSLASLPRA